MRVRRLAFVAALLSGSLAGCGATSEGEPSTTSTAATSPTSCVNGGCRSPQGPK